MEYLVWGLSSPWVPLIGAVVFTVATYDLLRLIIRGSFSDSEFIPRLVVSIVGFYFGYRAYPDSYRRRLAARLVVKERDRQLARQMEYDPDLKLKRLCLDGDVYGVSSEVDTALRSATQTDLMVEVGEPYQLPRSVHQYRVLLLKANTNASEVLFNGKKVRLESDLLGKPLPMQVRLSRTSFFASRCTNNSVLKTIEDTRSKTSTPVFDGWKSLVESSGHIRSLESNDMSNEIGVSTLAFTSDGDLLLIKQGPQNHRNSGNLVPSGSGSLDWKDVIRAGPSPTLIDVVLHGSERELREECGVPDHVAVQSHILGFFRDSIRGGKPEFLSISKIECTVRELLDVHSTEGGYTSHREDLHFGGLSTTVDDATALRKLRTFLLDHVLNAEFVQNNQTSPQLSYQLSLLICSISGRHPVEFLNAHGVFETVSLKNLNSADVEVINPISQFLLQHLR